jgi:soluble lytic murein transglycosylase-like protein
MKRLVVIAALFAVPVAARADVYSWTDDDGVVHFTNTPGDPRAKKVKLGDYTYEVTDDAGKLRRLFRVDVERYDDIIKEAAGYYSLPPQLVKAVIAAESGFEPAAVSHAGAQGLMQLIPATARDMRVRDAFDARDNIWGGARYLRILANEFRGDVRLTVAAYNAGPNAVKRAAGVPDLRETTTYVKRVLELYRHYLSSWPS